MAGRRKIALGASSAALAVALVMALSAAPGLGGTQRPEQANPKVRVQDNFFDPRSITVPDDSKVTFVWKGSNHHNVRFTKVPDGASRKGSRTKTHGKWTRSFYKPGVYRYVCTLFSGMRGTITVKAPATKQAQ